METKAGIAAACRLSRYYNYQAIPGKKLDKLINSDWWVGADLLTDLIKEGKTGREYRDSVAFVLLEEANVRNRTDTPVTDLIVSCFAVSPFYDLEVSIKWATFRIDCAIEELNRIDKVIWPVHEINVPVQLLLRDTGYKILEYDRSEEIIYFTR